MSRILGLLMVVVVVVVVKVSVVVGAITIKLE
jgi:hypothetical protein